MVSLSEGPGEDGLFSVPVGRGELEAGGGVPSASFPVPLPSVGWMGVRGVRGRGRGRRERALGREFSFSDKQTPSTFFMSRREQRQRSLEGHGSKGT